MKSRVKALLIKSNITIKEVMTVINRGVSQNSAEIPPGIALVVDDNNKLIGIVTDGDMRRALSVGAGINDSIDKVINKKISAASPVIPIISHEG